MKTIGLVINPYAGIGGPMGLKGSDGDAIRDLALSKGAIKKAGKRVEDALSYVKSHYKGDLKIITYPGEMGQGPTEKAGFTPLVLGELKKGITTAKDTKKAVELMTKEPVDLLLFAGGDGTARDIYSALGDASIPVMGIPAGVKMHSGVFALNPRRAGEALVDFLNASKVNFMESEVMDIDEEAFREGRVISKLYGYLFVPAFKKHIQNAKSGGSSELEDLKNLAFEVVENMEKDVLYLIGPGSTTAQISENLGFEGTLLGVDAILNKKLVGKDVNSFEIEQLMNGTGLKGSKIVVTVIGSQGYIFGRGNQQFTPDILEKVGKENIIIVATKDKLVTLLPSPLMVDTGSEAVNEMLIGYVRVITGLADYTYYKVSQ